MKVGDISMQSQVKSIVVNITISDTIKDVNIYINNIKLEFL